MAAFSFYLCPVSDVKVSNSKLSVDSEIVVIEPYAGVPVPKGRTPVGAYYRNTKGILTNLWSAIQGALTFNSSDFTTVENAANTVVSLKGRNVAGNYTSVNVTLNDAGIVTAASNGSGAAASLAATLTVGNTTGGTDIQVAAGDYIIVDGATASRIAQIGASKEVTFLDTATYPSLAELANLKGVTTVGGNLIRVADPSAVTFLRVNADNSVSLLSAAAFLTAIGASAVTPAALTKVDDTNVTLTLGGTPATALLQASSITAGWTGQLALSRGGTNKNMTAVNGGVVWTDADSMEVSAAGTSGQYLQSAGAASPVWVTEKKMWSGGIGSVVGTGATNYANIGIAVTLTENNTKLPFLMAGTLVGFGIQLGSAQPASGSLVVTLRFNGGSSSLTFTIAAGSAAGDYSDLVNTQAFTATDDYNIMVTNNAATNSGRINGVTFIYTS